MTHRLRRMHLGPGPIEYGKAERAIRRPLGVADADHQLGLHPVHRPHHDRRRIERRRLGRDPVQALPYHTHSVLVIATADGPTRQQAAVFVVADHEGVEWRLARPADDDEVVGLDGLDLEPEGASLACHVRALPVLRHHALETSFEAGFDQLESVLFYLVGYEEVPT